MSRGRPPLAPASRITWGILGGLGPIASADFLKTIYAQGPACREQDRPIVILISDPTLPDRTERILAGREDELLAPLEDRLQRLVDAGASALAICCVTMHHLLPWVRPALRARVVSLLDLIFDQLILSRRRHLVLCSSGSRATGLLERHPCWMQSRDRVVMPDPPDQDRIHALICRIKRGAVPTAWTDLVAGLLTKYRASGIIAGCTEIHTALASAARDAALPPGTVMVDPLQLLAARIRRGTAAATAVGARPETIHV